VLSPIDEAEAAGVDLSGWLSTTFRRLVYLLSITTQRHCCLHAAHRIGLAVVLLPLFTNTWPKTSPPGPYQWRPGGVRHWTWHVSGHADGFNSPFAESRERFDESLEIILKAWTTERFSYQGKYFQCENLCVRPKPVQTPHPPVRVGITSEVTFPLIGRMGYPIIINPSRVFALTELGPYIEQYRQAWYEAGHAGTPQVGLRIPLYVAETMEQAYAEPQASAMTAIRGLTDRVAHSASRRGYRRLERAGYPPEPHEL
jgi:hypothetical protein